MIGFMTTARPDSAEIRKNILEDAIKCTTAERNRQYGEPEDNFAKTAELWSAYLEMQLVPQDVANLMILLKVARSATGEKPNMDTWIDIAGYAACGGALECE